MHIKRNTMISPYSVFLKPYSILVVLSGKVQQKTDCCIEFSNSEVKQVLSVYAYRTLKKLGFTMV